MNVTVKPKGELNGLLVVVHCMVASGCATKFLRGVCVCVWGGGGGGDRYSPDRFMLNFNVHGY